MCPKDGIDIRAFSYAYAPDAEPVLRDFSLQVPAGCCCAIRGATASGKSTLLKAIAGVLPDGAFSGRIKIDDGGAGEENRVGLILQNPETQLLTPTVGAECAFGLENLAVSPEKMRAPIRRALAMAGLEVALATPVDALSMGQKYRLLVAAMLVMRPNVMLFDEPDNQLDPPGLAALAEIVRQLKNRGVAVMITGSPGQALESLVDQQVRLGDVPGCSLPHAGKDRAPAETEPAGTWPVLTVTGLAAAYQKDQPVCRDISFSLHPGQRLLVTGANGTGKTTLLKSLCGFVAPAGGTVAVFGNRPHPRHMVGRVGYHFQNPQRQLFEATVADEIAFTLRRTGWTKASAGHRADELISWCGLEAVADQSPHKLSFGQQHLVTLAAAVAPRPELLILDDPVAGLDPEKQATVFELIERMNRDHDTALVYACHDGSDLTGWAHRHIHLTGGGHAECAFA